MSVSQVDMVALIEGGGLQVCGVLSPIAEEGEHAPPSTDLQFVTVAVRQGDQVTTLHAAAPFDAEAFEFETDGRWKLKRKLGPEDRFKMGRSAVVSAVIILKREPAGLETLSWVQPVRIASAWQPTAQPHEVQVNLLAQPPERALEIGHSVSSSLAILRPDPAHPDTFSGRQRIDKLPPAVHVTP